MKVQVLSRTFGKLFIEQFKLVSWYTYCHFFSQKQQIANYQSEKKRLSLTLEEINEQEKAEQSKTSKW